MTRDDMAPFRRSLGFWLGVVLAFAGALVLAYFRMEWGLADVDSSHIHFADPAYICEFLGKAGVPGFGWGVLLFALATVLLAILTRRMVSTPLMVIIVGGIAFGVGVYAMGKRFLWPRYERIMVEAYIVDPPCLGCLYFPLSGYLGPEDRGWAVPLALQVAERAIGDNRWGAAYTLLKYDDPRALDILIPDLRAVRDAQQTRYRGSYPPEARATGVLVRAAAPCVGYRWWDMDVDVWQHAEKDFLTWWEEQKGQIEFRACYHGARGEPEY